MTRATIRAKFPMRPKRSRGQADEAPTASDSPPAPAEPQPSRSARMLALAHHIENLTDAGALADYADAARQLGLTRARLTQVMNLLLLAPEVQEAVLAGEVFASERSMRATTSDPTWAHQVQIFLREKQ